MLENHEIGQPPCRAVLTIFGRDGSKTELPFKLERTEQWTIGVGLTGVRIYGYQATHVPPDMSDSLIFGASARKGHHA